MSVSPPAVSGEVQEALVEHYQIVVRNLTKGRVTPILGAGASLYGRAGRSAAPHKQTEEEDARQHEGTDAGPAVQTESKAPDKPSEYWTGAPSARELAEYLVDEFALDVAPDDLLQVAQCVYALRGGSGEMYDALHTVFDRDFPPTGLHDFLAKIPGTLRDAGRGRPPLIVTTNYDDLMERALDARGESYEVIVYMAEGPQAGTFCHLAPDGTPEPIISPDTYLAVNPDQQTVVLKMHGFVCRRDEPDGADDSYVITEDHYIEYLTLTDLTKLLPKPVMARLLNCHLLFLGYSLRDWNFRAILHRIYEKRLHDNDWWAVLLNPNRIERKSWENRKVNLLNMPLEEYVPALESAFNARIARDLQKGR